MSTTTIRLSEELKARLARAAERSGTTAHRFIIEAIVEKAERLEREAEFRDAAEQRYAGIVESGKTIEWKAMRRYLVERAEGKRSRKPRAKQLAR